MFKQTKFAADSITDSDFVKRYNALLRSNGIRYVRFHKSGSRGYYLNAFMSNAKERPYVDVKRRPHMVGLNVKRTRAASVRLGWNQKEVKALADVAIVCRAIRLEREERTYRRLLVWTERRERLEQMRAIELLARAEYDEGAKAAKSAARYRARAERIRFELS